MTSDTTSDTAPEPTEETWIFAGSRVGQGGKRVHAWLPAADTTGETLWFAPKGSPTVGSEYRVRVVRNGDRLSRHGEPVYRGRHDNDEVRARLEVRHRAAETRLKITAMERADKRDSALDKALAPLLAVAATVRPMDRDAFLAYLMRRVNGAFG